MNMWTHPAEDTGPNEWNLPLGAGASEDGVSSGLVEGTEVATDLGWRPVEDLKVGDLVRTLEGGLQPVRKIARHLLWTGFDDCPVDLWPLAVPAGVIGNQKELFLLPDQAVRLQGRGTDPYMLVPALALAHLPGVERVPPFGMAEVLRPAFDDEQLIFTGHGALLHCPTNWSPVHARIHTGGYHMLNLPAAREVVGQIKVTVPLVKRRPGAVRAA